MQQPPVSQSQSEPHAILPWLICPECDHLITTPKDFDEGKLVCGQCGCVIHQRFERQRENLIATILAAFIALAASLAFPFIAFSSFGLSHSTHLFDTLMELGKYGYNTLAVFLFSTVVLIPALFLFLQLVCLTSLLYRLPVNWRLRLGRILFHLKPWVMSEVFLIGILVSMVKIMSMAEVGFGLSFWAFCGFNLLLVRTLILLDKQLVWQRICPDYELPKIEASSCLQPVRGIHIGYTGCHTCLSPVSGHRCDRCHSPVHERYPESLQRVVSLLVVSILLYIPANVLPIMHTTFLGSQEPSTIIGGVVLLWHHGSYPIAAVIFIASVMVPSGKIMAMFWLCWGVHKRDPLALPQRGRLYRVVEFIGRWSMIDVFVVAVLVALIQQEPFMAFYPGMAALSFAAVVVVTMIAAEQFDPRLIWDHDIVR